MASSRRFVDMAWALFRTNSFWQSGSWSSKRMICSPWFVATHELTEQYWQYFNFRFRLLRRSLQLPKNSKYATTVSIIRRDSSPRIAVLKWLRSRKDHGSHGHHRSLLDCFEKIPDTLRSRDQIWSDAFDLLQSLAVEVCAKDVAQVTAKTPRKMWIDPMWVENITWHGGFLFVFGIRQLKVWRFPKIVINIYCTPTSSIVFFGFSIVNHPAIGVPPWPSMAMETSTCRCVYRWIKSLAPLGKICCPSLMTKLVSIFIHSGSLSPKTI